MSLPRPLNAAPPAAGASAHPWHPLFVLSVAAAGVSVVMFVALVSAAACGPGNGPGLNSPTSPGAGLTPAPGRTPQNGTPAGATPTLVPGQAAASPTPRATSVPGVTLPCGDILVPIDKDHALAPDCAPGDLVSLPGSLSYFVDFPVVLRRQAADAFVELAAAAAKAGFALKVRSAYRSYEQQEITFASNVASGGIDYAERTSAHAGHSEHQLGTATDVTSASNGFGLEGFEATPEARWIADNAWKYGYILSYPPNKESVTGYAYEAWHIRFVGKDVAKQVHDSGLTLHEFLLRR
jgi:D-alanyl-D-alanine carboxypeptidase